MSYPVALLRLDSYAPERLRPALKELLAPLGGLEAFVRPGQRVLIKPNLLAGRPPEKAVTTHPALVAAVIDAVQKLGATALVGDSPGVGQARKVADRCGILEVIEERGAEWTPFEQSVGIETEGKTFHRLQVAQEVLDADLVINLPKLKTHQMMGLTCGVKNLFGAVIGTRKARLHLQAGSDNRFFALMLLELAEEIAPALTIVDAVVGMEGNGPGSGDPIEIGALLASPSPLAVDTLATELVGLRPDQVWTQLVARETGRAGSRLEELELYGTELADLRLDNFRPAKKTDLNFGLPRPVKKRLKKALTARPEIDSHNCRLCGDCINHCPPRAMFLDEQKIKIDYERCIRCYCCQELCPQGSIETRQGLLLRLHQFLRG